LIPANAVNGGRITVLRGSRKEKVDLQLGLTDGEWIEVIGGDLKEDDAIVMPRK
jgi:hypothetical protein